ncbi:pectinesterase family protein [Bacteroides sp. 224]|uniref:pectinesterase family protein n=1 Tax=Bacteroides sp. 224 TaxID=2302936 RepID=UPI0013D82CA4|nr:pectinesterase family protein [Bacteroides sp. 224]NDV67207.1 hypothetical protein [Bacteroides sp. 224]
MKYKNIFLFGALALLSASCSDDDDNNNEQASQPISFISEAKAYTRVNEGGDQWTSGDKLGTYMLATGTFTPVANSANVLYTAEADGASAKFSSTSAFTYPANGSKVDFIGYYPYSTEVSDFMYPINLANQSAGSAVHDLMRATSRTGYSLISSKEVSMSFAHQLAKVVFQFKNKAGEAIYPERLLIKGMNTAAQFDLTTATLSNISAAVDINPYKTSGGTFEAIVLPADIADTQVIEYTINSESFSWSIAEADAKVTALKVGNKYTFTITHDDSAAPIGSVEVDGSSIAPWGNGGGGDATAELVVNYTTFPTNEATNVHKDTYLKLNFKGDAPVIGTSGRIRVYKADDNTLVDEINMADEQVKLADNAVLNTKMNILGVGNSSNRYRVVNYDPVVIEENTAIIRLHYNKLDYNTKYYVTVDNKAIKHKDFFGIKESSKWMFTTKASPATPTDNAHTVTVGGDNSTADFRTIQAAMDFLVLNIAKDDAKTVFIQNGTYEELLFLRGVNNVTIKGESRDGVIIRYNNYDGWNSGTGGSVTIAPDAAMGTTVSKTGGRSIFLIETVDKLRFESLTLENIHVKSGSGDQAETLYANNDGKAIAFVNCNLLSCQDTLNLKGFCWFYNSLIAGDVDFIWGSPAAALFEKCEIRSVNDGYILQARVASGNKGFVFLNCDLTTTGKAAYMYLARTAGSSSYCDNITFANCKMADIYGTSGWGLAGGASGTLPNPSTATSTNGYKIYNCTNASGGSITINNSQYAYTLTEAEYTANFSSKEVILSAYTGGVNWFAE